MCSLPIVVDSPLQVGGVFACVIVDECIEKLVSTFDQICRWPAPSFSSTSRRRGRADRPKKTT
eukprot:scaffold11527_cov105-Skeletonema_dohrnii-CCMP3373.AAC.2